MTTPGEGRRRSRSRRRRPSRPFWGDAEAVAGPEHRITPVEHPTALVDSLGVPPFPRAEIAPHYFAAVYRRAAGLAVALATAAGLVRTDDEDPPATGTGDDRPHPTG